MGWTKIEKMDGTIEWICEHGVGHSDYESNKRLADFQGKDIKWYLIHGCDGCCDRPDFPGRKQK